jgi:Lon protease-like protein
MSDDPTVPEFHGVARLFPLPNLVLFPHVVQPLRIFEPRYKQMTQHALESDRLIAIVLIRPDSKVEYLSKPDVHDIGCLGRIIHDQRQPNGEYHLLLRGLCRLRIERELADDNLYRSAYAATLCDLPVSETGSLRLELIEAARKWFPDEGLIARQIEEIFQSEMSISALCDILAFALPLPYEFKQSLLEELHPRRRCQQLIQHLQSTAPPESLPMPREARKFPPDFSVN